MIRVSMSSTYAGQPPALAAIRTLPPWGRIGEADVLTMGANLPASGHTTRLGVPLSPSLTRCDAKVVVQVDAIQVKVAICRCRRGRRPQSRSSPLARRGGRDTRRGQLSWATGGVPFGGDRGQGGGDEPAVRVRRLRRAGHGHAVG